ncbi:hypothetical protein BH09BAC4_BH09BAC4_19220 [soil metagenome]
MQSCLLSLTLNHSFNKQLKGKFLLSLIYEKYRPLQIQVESVSCLIISIDHLQPNGVSPWSLQLSGGDFDNSTRNYELAEN